MAIVTGVREYRGVIQIHLDGRSFARVKKKFFEQNPLVEGDAVDEAEYIDRIAQLQYKFAYEAALTALEKSAKTAEEIKKTLLRKGYVEPVCDAIIERLTEVRLIDDKAYAERMVELKSEKPIGVYALRRKLRMKGIDEDIAEEALEQIDDEQQQHAAREMARKLSRRYAAIDPREARQKLSQALARRGFSWDSISAALDGLFDEEWE